MIYYETTNLNAEVSQVKILQLAKQFLDSIVLVFARGICASSNTCPLAAGYSSELPESR